MGIWTSNIHRTVYIIGRQSRATWGRPRPRPSDSTRLEDGRACTAAPTASAGRYSRGRRAACTAAAGRRTGRRGAPPRAARGPASTACPLRHHNTLHITTDTFDVYPAQHCNLSSTFRLNVACFICFLGSESVH